MNNQDIKSARLRDLASVFFKLGTVAFGGPAAHIAMMEEEVVKRRKWITHDQFLDLLGVTNLIPGPNSTEMAIHIGLAKAGWRGLVVAGVCFIFPAVAITLLLAHFYVTYGTVPKAAVFISGVHASVLAVILAAVFRLGKPMIKKGFMMTVLFATAVLDLIHIDEIILLLTAGLVGILWSNRNKMGENLSSFFLLSAMPSALSPVSTTVVNLPLTLKSLGFFFLKIGAVLYGSGYVLIAFLQGGLVDRYHWITQKQLLDGIAIGQFTPGPVLSTATFIGYLILGLRGAAVATVGIFLPSFIFVPITGPLIPKIRNSVSAKGFLDGVNAAALGLILAICIQLAAHTLTTYLLWGIFIFALGVSFFWNLSTVWIVLGGALLSWFFSLLSF